MIESAWDLAGAQYEITDRYPGWNPNPNSPLLALFEQTCKQLFGTDAGYIAIHAGLETGVVAGKYPQTDIIAIAC
jgi:dipeptidase D